jgi:VIT1/CCC1 family predicted Fe2+/Mn2+ transporter
VPILASDAIEPTTMDLRYWPAHGALMALLTARPLPASPSRSGNRRVLDPAERISEVLFGLIMVLTFTGSLSIAEAGREDIRAMLIGALGCNIAWGIIDGILYLMGSLADKGRNLAAYQAVLRAATPREAERLIADALPPVFASVLEPQDLDRMRRRLAELPEPPARARLGTSEWWGALAVFLLVFLSTFPPAVPFMVMRNAPTALRTSNAVAIGMLFIAGVAYARVVGRTPWVFGISMVALGCILVALTIALGG